MPVVTYGTYVTTMQPCIHTFEHPTTWPSHFLKLKYSSVYLQLPCTQESFRTRHHTTGGGGPCATSGVVPVTGRLMGGSHGTITLWSPTFILAAHVTYPMSEDVMSGKSGLCRTQPSSCVVHPSGYIRIARTECGLILRFRRYFGGCFHPQE